MTLNDEGIFDHETLKSGIVMENPIFEWAQAAHWWGYKWEEWQNGLTVDEKVFRIAVFRVDSQIQAVLNFIQYKRSKRASRQGKGGR